jgi:hypothetical protein
MLLLLLVLLIAMLILGLYYLFKLVKWVLKKKIRIKWALVGILTISLAYTIDFMFFTKMEFIQSKVYPDLYLIKNPINDKDSIQKVIQKKVLQKVNTEFFYKHGANEFSKNRKDELSYRIRFYEHYTGTFFLIPFGEAGTVHFIENEEDPGGFSSEELSHYNKYHVAEFNLEYDKNNTLNVVGNLNYFKDGAVIKTDTIVNLTAIR